VPHPVNVTLLTGARDGAVSSLKIKHIDVVAGKIVQDAREVRTKFSKTFATWFFPVDQEARDIVRKKPRSACSIAKTVALLRGSPVRRLISSGQFALETDGLLYIKPFKVTVFGVAFELGERSRSIDRVLTKSSGLL
jgi:hypothetical protein